MRAFTASLLVVAAVLTLSGCSFLTGMLTSRPNPQPCAVGVYQLLAQDAPVAADALTATEAILEDRLSALDVSPRLLEIQPPDTIVVRIPDSESDAARNVLSQQGLIQFVEIPSVFAAQVQDGQPLPPNMNVQVILDGRDIAAVRAGTDSTTNSPIVDLTFTSEGAAAFDAFAARAFSSNATDLNTVKFAIVLDGIVLSALTLQTDHFGGEAQISGNFRADEVKRLVALLESGALPASIRELSFSEEDCVPSL